MTPPPSPISIPLSQTSLTDPLIDLYHHYQSLRIPFNKSENCSDFSILSHAPTAVKHPIWRSEWKCPQSGKIYHSSPHTGTTTEEVFEQIDGFVYYAKKKNARRSAAHAALADIMGAALADIKGTLVTTAATETPRGERAASFETSVLTPTVSNITTLARFHHPAPIPPWALPLHKLHIHPSNVTILFESTAPSRLFSNTAIRCTMELRFPISLNVVGYAARTKRDAVRNAVVLIQEEMKRQGYTDVGFSGGGDNGGNVAWQFPKTCSYTIDADACFTGGFEGEVYLYELEFVVCGDDKGCSAGRNENRTRMGILFSGDIEVDLVKNVIEGNIPFKENESEHTMKVTILNKTVLDGIEVRNEMETLQKFNGMIQFWKEYGRNDNFQVNEIFQGRSYLLVPIMNNQSTSTALHEMQIDWNMIRDITRGKKKQLLSTIDSNWPYVPLVGQLSCLFISGVLSLFAISIIVPIFLRPLTQCEYITGTLSLALSLVSLFLHHRRPTFLPISSLSNYFLIQRKPANNTLYVYSTSPPSYPPNAKSSFLTPDQKSNLTEGKISHYIRKFNLDLNRASFQDYYTKKYGIPSCRFPNLALLPVHSLSKHAEFDLWSCPEDAGSIYLIPELVEVLPMPRDILYISRNVSTYMPILERSISVHKLAASLMAAASNVQSRLPPDNTPRKTSSRTLPSLLMEATSLYPCCTYNRLEFLGDAVLKFFAALNLFACNDEFQYDVEDLGLNLGRGCTNKALFKAALKIGLESVVYSNQNEIADGSLADVAEALLAVGYLYDENITIALLDALSLPLGLAMQKKMAGGGSTLRHWYLPLGTCQTVGYPFSLDRKWFAALVNVGTLLYCHEEKVSKLEKGFLLMMGLFPRVLEKTKKGDAQYERLKILLMAAFFDDSLGYRSDNGSSVFSSSKGSKAMGTTSSTTSVGNSSLGGSSFYSNDGDSQSFNSFNSAQLTDDDEDEEEEEGNSNSLTRVALLRDSLYVIGDSALHLILTQEIFERYEDATAGDMHLIKSCAITDDVLAYIMIKSDLVSCLYDSGSESTAEFRSMVLTADTLGDWSDNDGWVLKGGVAEFRLRRRLKRDELDVPQYVGLVGGRLHGHGSSKVDCELTEDLAFSFKSVVGALVLALGIRDTLEYVVGLLLEELLLLNPEEMREMYGESSNICENYQKGYESKLAKDMR